MHKRKEMEGGGSTRGHGLLVWRGQRAGKSKRGSDASAEARDARRSRLGGARTRGHWEGANSRGRAA